MSRRPISSSLCVPPWLQAVWSVLGVCWLVFVSPLGAQDVTFGPLITLPECPEINSEPAMVGLQNGTSVVTVKVRNPQGTFDYHSVSLDPEAGQVIANWSGPVGTIPVDPRLVAADEHVFLLDNPRDPAAGIDSSLQARLHDPQQGNDTGSSLQINPAGSRPTDVFAAVQLANGDVVAVFADTDPAGDGSVPRGTFWQRFSPQGVLLGAPELVVSASAADIRILPDPTGGFFVVWQANPTGFQVFGRHFDHQGQATGPVHLLAGASDRSATFDVAAFDDGTYLLLWTEFDLVIPHSLRGRRIAADGSPLPETLPVGGTPASGVSHLRVQGDAFGRAWVVWEDGGAVLFRMVHSDGSLGNITSVPSSHPDRVSFRPRITVDAEGNGLVLWVETTQTGQMYARRIEVNPSCTDGDTMLCLHQGRFQVEVEWTDYDGQIGQGRVVPFQSSDSGLFWFFDEANWEVMVKVINGCDFNGFYWIFSAATTDVAYDLKVTDTVTGLQQIYSNGLGEPAPANTDTMALMSCGHGPP